jgi:hypothetical protein
MTVNLTRRPLLHRGLLQQPWAAESTAAHLAHQQLMGPDQRKRRLGGDHSAGYRWLGNCDVSGKARHTAHGRQRPRQHPAPPPKRESASSVVDAATIMPSTDS